MDSTVDARRILTIPQFTEQTPGITKGQLQSWLYEEKRFGLRAAGAAFRIGKRVFIDPERFNVWLAARIEKAQRAL